MGDLTQMFLLRTGGREFGPLSAERLKSMAAHGKLRADDKERSLYKLTGDAR
jgi:hypothetical protein